MAPGMLKRFQLWCWPGVTGIRWLSWLCLHMGKLCSCSVLALELAGGGIGEPTHPEGLFRLRRSLQAEMWFFHKFSHGQHKMPLLFHTVLWSPRLQLLISAVTTKSSTLKPHTVHLGAQHIPPQAFAKQDITATGSLELEQLC